MTELKTFTNKYGYQKVLCPFCGEEESLKVTRGNPDNLAHLKRHIKIQAKNEALELILDNNDVIENKPHLNYMREHTSFKKVVVSNTREFDNDLKII